MKIGFIITFLFLLLPSLRAQQNYRIYINEFLASNVSIDADIVDFDDFSDWIELYNDEDVDVDIGGYFLTDNLGNPTRWRIPDGTIINAKSFLRFWADGYDNIPGRTLRRPYWPYDYFTTKYYHLNFGLSRSGEEIGLFNADSVLVDSVSYGLQLWDVSMGRKPDGSANWFYFGEPTPVASNSTEGTLNTVYTDDPVISLESGFFTGTQIVTITANSPSAVIKYTLDGSKPSSFSETYTTPLSVNQNTVLSVRVFEQDKLPSSIITKNYFIDENFSLPVISIAVQPDLMWDNIYGIYDNNYKERELPINFEFIEPNGDLGFKLNAGLRLTGQASLYYPQKSFTIETDDRFGTDEIKYRVFDQCELDIFTSLYLRNAGVPDNRSTFLRDGFQQSLVLNKVDIDCQAYLPSAVFLNGDYWGIYNIRDKINSNYLSSLHNVNPDDIDLLEYNLVSTPEVMEGSAENYNAFYNFIRYNDLAVDSNYRFIENWMDVDEYINYMIIEIFCDNVFWLDQNIRMWREQKEGAKWRWILHDLDFGFGMPNQRSIGYRNNTLKYATSSNISDPFVLPLWATLIFRQLLSNDEFKIKFIQRFSGFMNSILHKDTILTLIDEFQNNVSPEMPRHILRWNEGEYYYGYPIQNYPEWLSNVEVLRNFARNRHTYQRQHIVDYFGLSGTAKVAFNITEQNTGRLLINDVEEIIQSNTGIYFKDVPIKLKAIPEVGYRFVKWIGVANDFENPISFVLSEDSISITAQFEPASVNIIPSVISVNTTLLKNNSPYYAVSDIKVEPNITLTIESGVEILMPEKANILVNGRIIIAGVKEDPVIIKPNENSDKWGALSIVNSTDSSIISHLKIFSATKGSDFTRDKAAISGYNSNFLLSNISVENVDAPIFIQYGNIAVINSTLRTNYAGDLINIKYADFALVENCDLMGNDAFDSDAIDYDNIKYGIIRNNKMYNIYGFNSDAVDLGEGVINVLIENNIIFNVNDKGVSIGGGSKGIVKRNVIANCGQGVGIKDFYSYGYMEHNTFYANQYAVASFEKNIGAGGGSADVVNCIIANSKLSSLFVDELSYINVSYSLSNTNNLAGTQNINADPMFLNDLYLSYNSPAINKGDPSLPNDPDGSVADIGAYIFDEYRQTNLIINEIHYNPLEGDNYKFIEIVNSAGSSININNFRLSGDISCQFGNDTIAAGEYFVIAKDKASYDGNGYKVFQWQSGDLKISKGNILLQDDDGNTLDFVDYDSKYWWPKEADGQGSSLELMNPGLENMVSNSWRASSTMGGTPGKPNDSVIVKIFINEFLASNDDILPDEYGEYDDWIEIYNGNDFPVNLGGLYITDSRNNPLKQIIPEDSSEVTTIEPKGYLLFWADGQPEQGILHLSFKLDKEGEQLGLVQVVDNNNLFLDFIEFGEQLTNISYGRRPDGSGKWALLDPPTPLATNGEDPDDIEIPDNYLLFQNYPNPFNSATKIRYALPEAAKVKIVIYDILGCRVEVLLNEDKEAGFYEQEFKPVALASGVYFYRIESPNYFETKKMLLIK